MKTYIALFRGINVGGKHILPMKDLKSILANMGCEDVKTYIQSGNVVLRSSKQVDELAAEIGARIMQGFGFEPMVWLFELKELQDAIASNPFSTEVGNALHFFFLDEEPKSVDWEKMNTLKAETEDFKLHKKVFYLYAPEGIGRSRLVEKLGQCIRNPMTARNWNTVRKLVELVEG